MFGRGGTVRYEERDELCGCRRGNCPECDGRGTDRRNDRCSGCRGTGMHDRCKGRGVVKKTVTVHEKRWSNG